MAINRLQREHFYIFLSCLKLLQDRLVHADALISCGLRHMQLTINAFMCHVCVGMDFAGFTASETFLKNIKLE